MVAHMQTMGERKWMRLIGVFLSETIDEVQLGADAPGRPGGRFVDGLDDELGRADQVGCVDDLHHAFGMDQDLAVGKSAPKLLDVIGLEHLVDRTMAFPEHDPAGDRSFGRVAAERVRAGPRRSFVRAEFPSAWRYCGRGAGRGRTSTRLRRANAQSRTARALELVQTMPPCRPQKALSSAEELT